MRDRAIRRHQQKVAKARARRLLTLLDLPHIPLWVGLHAGTRVLCSCWMCGNPRRYFHELTRQELLADTANDTDQD